MGGEVTERDVETRRRQGMVILWAVTDYYTVVSCSLIVGGSHGFKKPRRSDVAESNGWQAGRERFPAHYFRGSAL